MDDVLDTRYQKPAPPLISHGTRFMQRAPGWTREAPRKTNGNQRREGSRSEYPAFEKSGLGACDMELGASFHNRPYSGPRSVTEHRRLQVSGSETGQSITSLAETVRSSLCGGWGCVAPVLQDSTNELAKRRKYRFRSMQERSGITAISIFRASCPVMWVHHQNLQLHKNSARGKADLS